MTAVSSPHASPDAKPHAPPAALFAVTVFASATLVFLVQPMVAKLVLPLLGGSSSVWNTSMAFFQIALLAGYAYAHALQRIRTVRAQALTHIGVLLAAAIALPLRVNGLAGPPSSDHPNLWLLSVLGLSIGAPFAILSATAPLVQAWYARTIGAQEGKEPYVLYAASNLGSLLALLAYPIVVEPVLTLAAQRYGWSTGYGVFVLIIGALALTVMRARTAPAEPVAAAAEATPRSRALEWAIWIALAAIPTSLMQGVTVYITTDIASAPFLWVLPLALYLTTFIIAFQAKPAIPPDITLTFQGAAMGACICLMPFHAAFFGLQLFVHLATFFLTALMCHQRLVAQRPEPARLTEFYLCLSIGGVVGGGFNAFLAPVIFNDVLEYPIVLVLACLARPWGDLRRVPIWTWAMLILGVAAAMGAPIAESFVRPHLTTRPIIGDLDQAEMFDMLMKGALTLAVICAFMIRDRAIFFLAVIAMLSYAAPAVGDRTETTQTWRSFFGVLKRSRTYDPPLGGEVKMLAHGTTLHGAQAQAPGMRCRPLVYYAPHTPIGQVFRTKQAEKAGLRIGAVGLGTGTVSAYVRPGDHLSFFEIDPLVQRISTDPANFSYTTECAKGAIDYVIGDARLTVAKQPADQFDVLLIDAFSSDAVPAHLLTVEAVRGYLTKLKPDGILILHLSNRNLDLMGAAQSVAHAAGGAALAQSFRPTDAQSKMWESPEDAVIVARTPAALAPYVATRLWKPGDPTRARPWTDDYTNLAGSMYAKLHERWEWLP